MQTIDHFLFPGAVFSDAATAFSGQYFYGYFRQLLP